MPLLSKKSILETNDIKTKTFEVPEWGGEVMIASMTAERHAIFESLAAGKSEHDALAYYAVSILVNEDGSPLFDSVDDIKALSKKSSVALMRVLSEGLSLNGVTEADIKETAKKSTGQGSSGT